MFGSIGTTELIIVLVIVLFIFGAGKLSSLGGAVGKAVSDFRTATDKGLINDDEAEAAPATDANQKA